MLERFEGHLTICFELAPGDAAAALRDARRFKKTPYVDDNGWVSLIVARRLTTRAKSLIVDLLHSTH